MTDLNLKLSSQFQTTLSQSGLWAYAVYFDSNKAPVWFSLVDNGAVQSSGEVTIPLPTTFNGGKVYFLVQSQADTQPHDLKTLITKQSDINWSNADSWDFRYDSFEVTLKSTPDDQGNLTSVNGFGLPMEVSVTYDDNTTDTRGYGVTGAQLFTQLSTIGNSQVVYTFGSGPLANQPRIAISPSEAVALSPPNGAFAAADWDTYLAALEVADSGVALTGFFNGAADANGVWHNAGFFSYQLEWDATNSVFWLSPTSNSQITGHIRITPTDLSNSIYSTLGNVGIYASKTDSEPYQIFKHASYPNDAYSMNSGENNQWGEVLTQFLTGFTAGYYTTEGAPLNPKDTTPVDLDKNWNWDPTYAFGQNLNGSAAPHFDPYSAQFFFHSNSYGSGYSDNLTKHLAQGGPLISVSEPGQNQNVQAIDITIFDDSETPSGYVTPVIYNYIAAGAGGYQQPDSTSSENSVKLVFSDGTMVLRDDTPISLDIHMGEDPSGNPIWHNVAFTPPAGQSPWQIWQLSKDGGGYTAQLQTGTPQGSGALLITDFPSNASGTYWYRVHVGEGDTLKTFNLYTEMTASGGKQQFLNPAYAGQEGSLAIDGLALIAPQQSTDQTIPTFTVNFLYSGGIAIDPDLLVRDPSESFHGDPAAPVAGTLSGGSFDAAAGQSGLTSNTITTTDAQIAFGWTGLNNSTGNTVSWITGYTNKTAGLSTAQITLTKANGQSLAPITVTADVDGQWQTAAQNLANDVYTVTMTELLSDGTAVGGTSGKLNLTVNVAETTLEAGAGGDAFGLALDGTDDPAGNWIGLEATGASVPAGTTLLIYATDAQGDLLSRDGLSSGGSVTFEDAIRATIGSVHADGGETLLLGAQSLYLEAGAELRFARLSQDGAVETAPDVDVVERADGRLDVQVDGISLIVETDNTLSAIETQGEVQRSVNEALLHLEEGSQLRIDLLGSCGNTNTLAFIRMDMDAGGWSVGGVAYGDTSDFKTAVRDHLDPGFSYTNGGSFSETVNWTVAGETGYYAPVLISQNGDILVIGDANPGGHDQIRLFGHNTFGFEDLTHDQGSDFDYNDMVMRIAPSSSGSLDDHPLV